MEAHKTQTKDVYLETIQDVAFNAKRMFDNDQRTPDFIPFGTVRIINLDLIEWTDEVSREITQMFVDQANGQENSLSFLERLKRMFDAEALAIEKKIGSDEFDRDKQIIFGVKFYPDYQAGLNESRKFQKCIDLAIDELQKVDDLAIDELQKVDDQATTLKAVTKDKHIVRMKMIYTYLKDNKYIDCPENDFLYWFGLFEAERPPKKMKWLKADSKLKNIIHHICGKSGEKYIRTAFIFNNGYITTNYKKDYEGSELFHKIESYLFHAVTKI